MARVRRFWPSATCWSSQRSRWHRARRPTLAQQGAAKVEKTGPQGASNQPQGPRMGAFTARGRARHQAEGAG